ncbi:hypothetical protein RJT34_31402 [Clitoria ternatea]|uniref:Uncharacterized protein n=1 Tax=Clitoria ternatea TaxID=43366 RepID=A0AAN9EYH9_CLITE
MIYVSVNSGSKLVCIVMPVNCLLFNCHHVLLIPVNNQVLVHCSVTFSSICNLNGWILKIYLLLLTLTLFILPYWKSKFN